MVPFTLNNIAEYVSEMALKINAPSNLLPTFGYSNDGGHPHIEVDSAGLLHYVTVERGQVLERKTTALPDELFYWVFSSITFSMAVKHELKHRVEQQDSRRIIFEKQEELLGMLSNTWRQKERDYHSGILIKHPFDDLASVRATYIGQLRQRGLSDSDINKLAYGRYPCNDE